MSRKRDVFQEEEAIKVGCAFSHLSISINKDMRNLDPFIEEAMQQVKMRLTPPMLQIREVQATVPELEITMENDQRTNMYHSNIKWFEDLLYRHKQHIKKQVQEEIYQKWQNLSHSERKYSDPTDL